MEDILIEVYCGSVEGAVSAEKGGADRIELNSSLFLGGLTPSIGTIKESVKRVDIPIISMIRPRKSGFCYTEAEMSVIERDIKAAIEAGVEGIAIGILNSDGTIDKERMKRIVELSGDKEVVFHRAFDVVADPYQAMEDLIELGVDRILTKGQGNRVEAGLDLLKDLINKANDRIEFVIGGAKNYNYEYIISELNCEQLHISSLAEQKDVSTQNVPDVYFGSALYPSEDKYNVVDKDGVNKLSTKIKEFK